MIDLTGIESVTSSTERLPVGGYVIRIDEAKDYPDEMFVELVWDVAEGKYKDFYKDAPEWVHQQRWYYKGKAAGMFKGNIETVEADNPNFDADKVYKGESIAGLKGCRFGGIVQERYYTSKDGEEKTALEIRSVKPIEVIKSGNFTMPEPRRPKDSARGNNTTTTTTTTTDATADTYNVPF